MTAFKMKRYADVLTNRYSHIIRTTRLKFFGHIARADPSMDHSRALRSSVALCEGTGTTDQADLVKLGSAQLNPMSLHSTLVRQLSVIEHKLDRHGGTRENGDVPLTIQPTFALLAGVDCH